MPSPLTVAKTTYTCSLCGGIFDSTRSEADAVMEYQQTFSDEQRAREGEPQVVCDDCYRMMLAQMPPELL